MGGITMRPERALAGSFTRPVAVTGAVLLALGPEPPSLGDLDTPERRVGVNAGGHLEQVARHLLPHATIVTADNAALAGLLRSGRADAVVSDDAEATVLAASLPGSVRSDLLTRDRKAYLGRDPTLVARLDAWLRDREADGTLAALRRQWLGADEGASRSAFDSDLDALLAFVDLRLSLMPLVAAAKEAAGLAVEDPAQEARVLAAVSERATERGLDPASAADLFRVQLDAARAAQRRFLATPPGTRSPRTVADLDELRTAIAAISTTIVARAADVAAAPEALAAERAPHLAERLDPALAGPEARLAIGRAVLRLRRTPRP
jgi:cyclohexadienyl dehydratase